MKHDPYDASSADITLHVPDALAGIRLGRVLGVGGMGRVYHGRHPILDIDVAIKVLHSGRCDEQRFLTEARLAARVQHDRVVRILHAGIEDGCRFLVLEYVDGHTLKQVVEERGRLPWREALGLTLQAAEGLAAAHRLGIVHRDVKPSNFLLDHQGRLKLADLGVARNILGSSDSTMAGDVVGTVAYMAPEQKDDAASVTPAADVYALGATLGYLLSDLTPRRLLKTGGLHAVDATIPAPVQDLVRRMMASDPWDRPADGSAVVGELERLLGLATASTVPVATTSERRFGGSRRRWLAAAAGLAAVLLVGWTTVPGHSPLVGEAPAPVIAAPADPWQSPTRAVFVLGEDLPAAARAGLEQACVASGLPLVERERIDDLLREHALAGNGRVDPATASRFGRLIGGHLALFASAVEDRIEVRCVLVETGEIAASRLVPHAEVGGATASCLATAIGLIEQRGRISHQDGNTVVSLGARHGLRAGATLELRATADGPVVAKATVQKVEAQRATLALPTGASVPDGTLALRTAQ
jgi:hypothetical protein